MDAIKKDELGSNDAYDLDTQRVAQPANPPALPRANFRGDWYQGSIADLERVRVDRSRTLAQARAISCPEFDPSPNSFPPNDSPDSASLGSDSSTQQENGIVSSERPSDVHGCDRSPYERPQHIEKVAMNRTIRPSSKSTVSDSVIVACDEEPPGLE